MTLDSAHTKDVLDNLGENVTGKKGKKKWFLCLCNSSIVLRHPDHSLGGTFFWSHHEKFVVIDNQIAFLGGIDLCFG